MNSTSPGLGGKISGWVGSFVGSILGSPAENVAELAITKELPISKLFGIDRQALGESIAQSSLTIGKRVGIGATEGAAFGGIQDTVDDIKNIQNGESLDPIKNIYNIAQSAFFGGLMAPVHAFVSDKFKPHKEILKENKLFDKDGSDDVSTSAAQNMEQGQDPNVEVPMKNAAERTINELHRKLKEKNISPEEMLDSLDDAKKNIDLELEGNKNQINDLEEMKEHSEEQKDKLKSLLEAKDRLVSASKAEEVNRFMVNNPDFNVTHNELNQFSNQLDNPKMDFAQGRRHENLFDDEGDLNNQQLNLNERYTDEHKAQLEESSKLTKQQEKTLKDIKGSNEKLSRLQNAIKSTILCLTGS